MIIESSIPTTITLLSDGWWQAVHVVAGVVGMMLFIFGSYQEQKGIVNEISLELKATFLCRGTDREGEAFHYAACKLHFPVVTLNMRILNIEIAPLDIESA